MGKGGQEVAKVMLLGAVALIEKLKCPLLLWEKSLVFPALSVVFGRSQSPTFLFEGPQTQQLLQ